MKRTNIIDIRNGHRHLVGKYDPAAKTILIERKGDLTIIRILPNGEIEVINTKAAA